MSDRADRWVRCPRCKGTRGVGVQTGGFPEYNKASCPCGWEGRETDLLPREPEPEKPEPLGFRVGVPRKSAFYTDVAKLPVGLKHLYRGPNRLVPFHEKLPIQGGSSDMLVPASELRTQFRAPGRCGKYVGDNDGTCPQLTCVREEGHPGLCDNVSDLDDVNHALLYTHSVRKGTVIGIDPGGQDETHEVVVRNGVVEEVHVYCPRGSNVDVHVGRTASGALQTRTEVDGELYEETLGPIRVQSIKATTRKLKARWSAVPADEVFDKDALAAAFESEKEAAKTLIAASLGVPKDFLDGAYGKGPIEAELERRTRAQRIEALDRAMDSFKSTLAPEAAAEFDAIYQRIKARLAALGAVPVVMSVPPCTCDIFCDDPCPQHAVENAAQDARLAAWPTPPDVREQVRAITMDEIVAVQPMTAPVEMEIEFVYQPSAAVVGKHYFITYKVPALTGDEKLEAGPYETIEEARRHYSDIFNYEGVEQVEIVGRDIVEAKP